MAKAIDWSNQKVGKWTVIQRAENSSSGDARWLCRCECGKKQLIRSCTLTSRSKGCRSCVHKGRIAAKGSSSPHWKGHGEISAKYWFSVTRHAIDRHLEFDVSIEYAWDLFEHQDRKCALTGAELKFGVNGAQTASLDRIDSNEGYTPANIQWVHKDINFMKRKMSTEGFISWCRAVVAHATISV